MGTKTEKQEIGQIGEDIATRFLVKHSFEVILRNYRKKYGEIDNQSPRGKPTGYDRNMVLGE
jgi:hypothetical protein